MGPAHNVGQGLSYYILIINAEVVVRSTVSKISDDDIPPMDPRERQKLFTDRINSLIGNFQHTYIQRSEQVHVHMDDIYIDLFEFNTHDEDESKHQIVDEGTKDDTKPDAENIRINDTIDAEINDKWINLLVPTSKAGEVIHGTVKRRK